MSKDRSQEHVTCTACTKEYTYKAFSEQSKMYNCFAVASSVRFPSLESKPSFVTDPVTGSPSPSVLHSTKFYSF